MSASKVSITSLLLLSAMLSGCGEKTEKEESALNSSTEMSQDNQSESATGAKGEVTELGLSNDMQEFSSDKSKLLTLKGQVLFQEFEGGFFGFIDENGNKYTPMGMEKKHLRHGLVIELSGRVLPDMITTTQFGQVIRVESASIIDESNAAAPGRPEINKQDI